MILGLGAQVKYSGKEAPIEGGSDIVAILGVKICPSGLETRSRGRDFNLGS